MRTLIEKIAMVTVCLLPLASSASEPLPFIICQMFLQNSYSALTLDDYPVLNFDQFENKQRLATTSFTTLRNPQIHHYSGAGHHYLMKAQFGGEEVFIKFPSRLMKKTILRGIKNTELFSRLNIGPKFYGLVYDEHGRLGIVTRFISGAPITSYSQTAPEGISLSPASLQRLTEISRTLTALKFQGGDIQFIFDSMGKPYLVDPELITYNDEDSTYRGHFAAEITSLIGNIQRLISKRPH